MPVGSKAAALLLLILGVPLTTLAQRGASSASRQSYVDIYVPIAETHRTGQNAKRLPPAFFDRYIA
ncbi:hypothetical protein SAMN04490197_1031 [Pseudomonas orientalis]|uniref:Uncharacterized protein n=1 Tax=Pseudomonas orientalis TaxID=76758 RepID=A0A8B3XTM4_9PSED|nr:hypothetical protein SAMN04490197_1031 [Pseudomonas orientalis]